MNHDAGWTARPLFVLSIVLALGSHAARAGDPPAGAAPAAKPREAAHTATPADRIGKLPDGVGIAVGARAPDAALHDAAGAEVRLASLIAKGPVLLVFYRGGWCPFCSYQVQELVAAYPDFAKRGVTLVLVSVDRSEEAAKTQAAYETPFPVLSDPDLAAHKAFRVVHEVGEAELAKLKGFGIDLERASDRTHHTIAIPSMFLIDRDGLVRWAHADPDYKTRPTPEQLLAAIDAAGVRSVNGGQR